LISWSTVYISGFKDAPVSWELKEHGFSNTGENDTLVMLNSCSALLAQITGAHDELQ
jgi:hypothetical protein